MNEIAAPKTIHVVSAAKQKTNQTMTNSNTAIQVTYSDSKLRTLVEEYITM